MIYIELQFRYCDTIEKAKTDPAGATVHMMNYGESRNTEENAVSLSKYLQMDEKQKDHEIQQAVVRLQKRIHEILYLVETNKSYTLQNEAREKIE